MRRARHRREQRLRVRPLSAAFTFHFSRLIHSGLGDRADLNLTRFFGIFVTDETEEKKRKDSRKMTCVWCRARRNTCTFITLHCDNPDACYFQLHSLYFVSSLSLIFFSFLHFFSRGSNVRISNAKKKKNIEQVQGKINVRDVE